MPYMTLHETPHSISPRPAPEKACAPVADLTDDLRTLADDMLATMYDAPGVGLAAPQVGVLTRLVVLDCVKEEGEKPRPLIMFNPQIVASSEELNTYEEGCLSMPEQFADVTRPAEVEVAGSTATAKSSVKRWRGFGRPVCSTRSTTLKVSCSLITSSR